MPPFLPPLAKSLLMVYHLEDPCCVGFLRERGGEYIIEAGTQIANQDGGGMKVAEFQKTKLL
jgi:hypothetical protein